MDNGLEDNELIIETVADPAYFEQNKALKPERFLKGVNLFM